MRFKRMFHYFNVREDSAIPYVQGKYVHSPSLVYADFGKPQLTPWLDWHEAVLQLSTNISLFVMYNIYTGMIRKTLCLEGITCRISQIYVHTNVRQHNLFIL